MASYYVLRITRVGMERKMELTQADITLDYQTDDYSITDTRECEQVHDTIDMPVPFVDHLKYMMTESMCLLCSLTT